MVDRVDETQVFGQQWADRGRSATGGVAHRTGLPTKEYGAQGPLNSTKVDHATDTYDTIAWLVKHVPESNGRVGTIGGSYEGYTTVMSTVRPHPALKVAVPFAPMVDGWIGDDWFHNGAFRQDGSLDYIYDQEATRKSEEKWWSGNRDTYDEFLRTGSAGDMAASRGLEQLGFWRAIADHTAYDSFWHDQAVDKLLAKEPLRVPMLIVSDSTNRRVYKIRRGKDRRFGTRDDIVQSFGTHKYGFTTAEDVAIRGKHLFIISSRQEYILETTMKGGLVQKIDISGLGIRSASGIAFAPGTDGGRSRLYLTASGVDNNVNPNENDGRLFELRFVKTP